MSFPVHSYRCEDVFRAFPAPCIYITENRLMLKEILYVQNLYEVIVVEKHYIYKHSYSKSTK